MTICRPGLTSEQRHYRFKSPDGAWLSVEGRGDPQHPAVLLALPVGISFAALSPLATRLQAEFNVLIAQSRWVLDDDIAKLTPSYAIDLGTHAADIEYIVSTLDVPLVNLVGYCSGTLLTLAAAGRLGRKLGRVVFCNSAFALRQDGTAYEAALLDLVGRYAHRRRMAEIIYPSVAQRMSEEAAEECLLRQFSQFRNFSTFFKYLQVIRALYRDGLDEVKSPIAAACLAVSGGKDPWTPPAQVELVRHLLPRFEHHVVLTGDHYLPCREGSSALDVIHKFLLGQVPDDSPVELQAGGPVSR